MPTANEVTECLCGKQLGPMVDNRKQCTFCECAAVFNNGEFAGWDTGDRYGRLRKERQDAGRCIASVFLPGLDVWGGQCSRKRGYGNRGLYCKQHAKKYKGF